MRLRVDDDFSECPQRLDAGVCLRQFVESEHTVHLDAEAPIGETLSDAAQYRGSVVRKGHNRHESQVGVGLFCRHRGTAVESNGGSSPVALT